MLHSNLWGVMLKCGGNKNPEYAYIYLCSRGHRLTGGQMYGKHHVSAAYLYQISPTQPCKQGLVDQGKLMSLVHQKGFQIDSTAGPLLCSPLSPLLLVYAIPRDGKLKGEKDSITNMQPLLRIVYSFERGDLHKWGAFLSKIMV